MKPEQAPFGLKIGWIRDCALLKENDSSSQIRRNYQFEISPNLVLLLSQPADQ
jgi:hypothetical protein